MTRDGGFGGSADERDITGPASRSSRRSGSRVRPGGGTRFVHLTGTRSWWTSRGGSRPSTNCTSGKSDRPGRSRPQSEIGSTRFLVGWSRAAGQRGLSTSSPRHPSRPQARPCLTTRGTYLEPQLQVLRGVRLRLGERKVARRDPAHATPSSSKSRATERSRGQRAQIPRDN